MFPLQTTAPTRSPPLVTWGLIAANCAIFLFQIGLGPEELEHFLYQFALIPLAISHLCHSRISSVTLSIISPSSATCSCTAAGCT